MDRRTDGRYQVHYLPASLSIITQDMNGNLSSHKFGNYRMLNDMSITLTLFLRKKPVMEGKRSVPDMKLGITVDDTVQLVASEIASSYN